jgi:predicted TIM-barrel fold metal-dependent hydrolase
MKFHSETKSGSLSRALPAIDDPEGATVPANLPPVIDAHVHLFPDGLFQSIRQWFDQFAWPIRYRLNSDQVLSFLFSRGVRHVVGLHYAHRPGIARELNHYMAGLCACYDRLTGLATLYPGEPDARSILKEAFEMGLSGLKLHAHVQCYEMGSPSMGELYETCEANGKVLVMHAGREPKSPAYLCDPYALCSAARVKQVLLDHPALRICVPHLGADEYEAYREMLLEYDNLWLDTTMMLADYFPGANPPPLSDFRPDRIMYGTDFPNIPYAWDREFGKLIQMGLPEETLANILSRNARAFFAIPDSAMGETKIEGHSVAENPIF